MGLTTKGRELSKVIQEKNYSFLSTGTQPHWPIDGNKILDLLDYFVTNGISSTYTDIQSSYNLTSDHSPIRATLSTSVIVSFCGAAPVNPIQQSCKDINQKSSEPLPMRPGT